MKCSKIIKTFGNIREISELYNVFSWIYLMYWDISKYWQCKVAKLAKLLCQVGNACFFFMSLQWWKACITWTITATSSSAVIMFQMVWTWQRICNPPKRKYCFSRGVLTGPANLNQVSWSPDPAWLRSSHTIVSLSPTKLGKRRSTQTLRHFSVY